MTLRTLVIGYGSIGSRHARLLAELGCNSAVFSRREIDFPLAYSDLEQALDRHQPEYVVIANATSLHHDALCALADAGYAGRVLIEKPVFDEIHAIPAHRFSDVRVAYNLRFHPALQKVRELLKGQVPLSVNAYVGQYLPDWRPGTDYRLSYSARMAQGGGVLRDLSHELDYLGMLFGTWRCVAALGGHMSPLEIDSDDVFSLLYATDTCPVVSLQMNYLDHPGQRCLTINTEEHTIQADLRTATVMLDGIPVAQYEVVRDQTYRAMHKAIMNGETADVCSLLEGLETMNLIAATEKAARQGNWMKR